MATVDSSLTWHWPHVNISEDVRETASAWIKEQGIKEYAIIQIDDDMPVVSFRDTEDLLAFKLAFKHGLNV